MPPDFVRFEDVPVEEIRAQYSYDPETGIFRHLLTRGGTKAGEVAGHKNPSGYWCLSVRRRACRASRVAWVLVTGAWPTHLIDHRDLDLLNNRWENLREANRSQNGANSRCKKNSTSGIKGAKRDKKRWAARITVMGKYYHLGMFDTPEEAGRAYTLAAKQHFGEFARGTCPGEVL